MTPGIERASGWVRVAAEALWRTLVVLAGLHLYWLLGGTWGLHAASGGAYSDVTTGLRIQSALMVVLLVGAALVVRARAGLVRAPFSARVVRIAMWVLTALLGLTALANVAAATNCERYGIGPFVFVLALLALTVAAPGTDWRRIRRPHRTQPSH